MQPHINDPRQSFINKNLQPRERSCNFLLEIIGIRQPFNWVLFFSLFSYVQKEWILFGLNIFFLIIVSYQQTIIPYYIGLILDQSSNQKQQPSYGLKYLVISISVLTISTFFSGFVNGILQERIFLSIKRSAYTKFLHMDVHFFQMNKIGQLSSRMHVDIAQAKQSISQNLLTFGKSVLGIVGNIIVLLFMSIKLSLVMLFLIPLYIILTMIYSGKAKLLVKQYRTIAAKAASIAQQAFGNIPIIRAFCAQQFQKEKYDSIIKQGLQVRFRQGILNGIYFSMSGLIPQIGTMIVLSYGGSLAIDDKISIGQLTSFIIYSNLLLNNINNFSNSYSDVVSGLAAFQRINQLMEYKPLLQQTNSNILPLLNSPIIAQFRDVYFSYPNNNVPALKNINFKLFKGQCLAIVGTSGSGKSSIAKLIERLYQFQEGQIIVFGQDIRRINTKELRRNITVVKQDPLLFSGNILDNILYGNQMAGKGTISQSLTLSGCDQFLDSLQEGLLTQIGQRGKKLSGGQKQRITIGRALLGKPQILIFDQATASLDNKNQQLVRQSISQIKDKKETTIMIIAHRLSTVMQADRIVVLERGTIVQQGTHQTLLKLNGHYSDLIHAMKIKSNTL